MNKRQLLTTLGATGATAFLLESSARAAIPSTVISVKDFGAAGNGSANDTSSIQNAINACPEYGVVFFPAGTYAIGSQLVINSNNVTLQGPAKILAMPGSSFEYMLYASNKTGLNVIQLEFDANQNARVANQTVRFMGAAFFGCTDSSFFLCIARNTLGYGGISAVGLAICGGSTRGMLQNCRLINCGGTSGLNSSDGIFTSGTQNVISGCVASSCTDTGFVIESSDNSVISNCSALNCSAGAAITNASSTDKSGNIINGFTCKNWNASNTGGIQIGIPSADAGRLLDTEVSNVVMSADSGSPVAYGAAINIRSGANAKAVGVAISNVRINGSRNQGILVNGDNVSITNCQINGTIDSCIQFQTSATGGYVGSCYLTGGSFGISANGSASLIAQGNVLKSNTTAIYAFNSSTITAVMNVVKLPVATRYGKDASAVLEIVGIDGNQLMVNNATGSQATGTIVNKFVVVDKSGSPLGYVPVYNT